MAKRSQSYWEEIKHILQLEYPWSRIRGKTFLISGASGTIGQVIVDLLMEMNRLYDYGCKVIAVSRNQEKAKDIFCPYWEEELFEYLSCDVTENLEIKEHVDYIFHAASNTHPVQYARDPVGTITANALGAYRLLKIAAESKAEFLLFSSVEIYGENDLHKDAFCETDMGYLNCASLRAGYPESKRLAESMCFAFSKQYGVNFKIVRLARVYGETLSQQDSKAISQFFRQALKKEDIVLKSEGIQLYSYIYIMDCVAGIFAVLLNGKNEEVYNISGTDSAITLYDLAGLLADVFDVSVVREMPSETEEAGFSKATKAVLDNSRLIELGWEERTPMRAGIVKVKQALYSPQDTGSRL